MTTNDTGGNDSDGVECPTCGREFDSEGGMKIHHNRAHGESIAGVLTDCDWCGEEYRVSRKKDERTERNLCSEDCLSECFSEERSGEDGPGWKGKTEVACTWCGTLTEKFPSRVDGRKHFCNSSCHAAWRKTNWAAEDWPNYQGAKVDAECAWCGDNLRRLEWRVDEFEHQFCGQDCHGEWRSENIRGEDHPNWDGGEFPYGPGWDERKKEKVRERDDYECQDPQCSKTQEDNLAEYGRKLHVHHIQKARSFDDPEERNAMENLIALCSSCHPRWEAMSPLRPQ